MSQRFNSDMLALARDLRAMTQTALADASGITQGFISKLERGEKDASPERIKRLAAALGCKESFFFLSGEYSGIGLSTAFFRKRAGALTSEIRYVQAEVAIRRLHLSTLLRAVDINKSARVFQKMEIDDFDGKAEDIARLVRASWSMPLGPIANLVNAIESAGGVVFMFDFGTKRIDAVSQWPDDLPPLFFVNTRAPFDRVRFSLAHELGHVVMHSAATDTMETEANAFASEFLMPSRIIAPQLEGITLRRAADMKPYWRVSMSALIRQARRVGSISSGTYAKLFRQLSYLGLRQDERTPISPETPMLFNQILASYIGALQNSVPEMAELFGLASEEYQRRYTEQGRGLRLAAN